MLALIVYINVFMAGVVITLVIWYTYAHFANKKNPAKPKIEVPSLPKATRDRLMLEAEEKFNKVILHAKSELEEDLHEAATAIVNNLKVIGNDVAKTEMDRYRAGLEEVRKQTESTIQNATSEVTKHQEEIKTSLENHRKQLEEALTKNIADEKQRRIDDMDSKLADAVTAFLLETLGHDVDLGAQTTYITKMLDEHKAEIAKELDNA